MDPVKPEEAVNSEEAWFQTLVRTDAAGVIDLFKDAPGYVKESRTCVLAAVCLNGLALEFAASPLREDKEIVCAAITQDGSSLVYDGGGLHHDSDCLKCSGLWDAEPRTYPRPEEAILSMQFTQRAIKLALAMKRDPFLSQFEVYNPSTWCDPDFRLHLQRSMACNGFMIQLEETEGLSKSQEVELEMGKEAGIKIFRTSTDNVDGLSSRVQAWYCNGCESKDLEDIGQRLTEGRRVAM